MIAYKPELLKQTVIKSVGADVSVEANTSGRRSGLDVWFAPWRKRDGPVFQLKPIGLRRHLVTMEFGKSSGLCLKRIAGRKVEQTTLSEALLKSIKANADFDFESLREEITPALMWSAQVKGLGSQHADESLISTTKNVMVPMIAAMAELLGFEEIVEFEPEFEGAVTKKLISVRERSPRNRLLALQLHGYECGTCGLKPLETFGEAFGGILEVHHIEPVSNLSQPRAYDPEIDLIPLCPNCHRMIHQINPPHTPAQLRTILKKQHA